MNNRSLLQTLPEPIRTAASMAKLTLTARRRRFREVGEGTLRHLVEAGGLQPHAQVLEVGCGYGRIALPLTQYLSDSGRYEGIDIIAGEIAWAQRHITPKRPNFRFRHTDVYNKYYNPGGLLTASEYRFPFEDAEFDFVYLTSVFTHMLQRDVEHYLKEIARVLQPGGRCLASFFLLDERTNPGRARTGFPDAAEGCRLCSREMPEWEVAYEESEARLMYARSGLQIQEPIRYGIQDSIVAVKP